MSKINEEKQAAVPQKVLHELLEYDELTGVISNKVHRSSRARAGQAAGYKNKDGYIVIVINGYLHHAHRLAWVMAHGEYPNGKQPYIDHINGDPSDNRIVNLKVSSGAENQRNLKRDSRNTSGVTGVHLVWAWGSKPRKLWYWAASWYNEKGKNQSKKFPIHKLGEEVAKQMAIEYRIEQIRLLETKFGIIYSERHGT